jgi:hypothetical protein
MNNGTATLARAAFPALRSASLRDFGPSLFLFHAGAGAGNRSSLARTSERLSATRIAKPKAIKEIPVASARDNGNSTAQSQKVAEGLVHRQ